MKKNEDKIAVAVSGGVDSGTALYLLKKKGYDLIAVYCEHFECTENTGVLSCCSADSQRRARETASYLNIPFYSLNFIEDFRETVVNSFVSYYKEGKTPNPCIWCNSRIRFSKMIEKLKSMGVNKIATGHYARIIDNRLYKGVDPVKDQSYFLYSIKREFMADIMFPLGEMKKMEVIKIAEEAGLPVSYAEESQDSCILMENDLSRFLNKNTEMKKGDIVDSNGNKFGTHEGYEQFTIGQRKGLGGGFKNRKYVVDIIPERGTVVIGDESELYKNNVKILLNTGINNIKINDRVTAKLRSTAPDKECIIEELDIKSNICKIRFIEPQRSPTKGQAAVLYMGEEVLGGGEIIGSN